jgi:hypothetical protein
MRAVTDLSTSCHVFTRNIIILSEWRIAVTKYLYCGTRRKRRNKYDLSYEGYLFILLQK